MSNNEIKKGVNNDVKSGKKIIKFLPENFFEKVLDLELKLKRDFHLSILEELINLYSVIFYLHPGCYRILRKQ